MELLITSSSSISGLILSNSAYTLTRARPGEEDEIVFDKMVTRETIIFSIGSSIQKDALFFEFDDYLKISYLHKKEPYEYTKYLLKRPERDFISSAIYLPKQKGVAIYKNGSYFPGANIFTTGYWAWFEKLSTLLPYDYTAFK